MQTHELRRVSALELRTQLGLLIYEAFPCQLSSLMAFRFGIPDDVPITHAHAWLSLPAVEAISLAPILLMQVFNLDAIFAKLVGFIVTLWTKVVTQAQVK